MGLVIPSKWKPELHFLLGLSIIELLLNRGARPEPPYILQTMVEALRFEYQWYAFVGILIFLAVGVALIARIIEEVQYRFLGGKIEAMDIWITAAAAPVALARFMIFDYSAIVYYASWVYIGLCAVYLGMLFAWKFKNSK